eukprot:jgi/Ulvmu1/6095/UM027_0073.1
MVALLNCGLLDQPQSCAAISFSNGGGPTIALASSSESMTLYSEMLKMEYTQERRDYKQEYQLERGFKMIEKFEKQQARQDKQAKEIESLKSMGMWAYVLHGDERNSPAARATEGK